MNRQRGGIFLGSLKLLVMLVVAYLICRTDAHLDKKYQAPPPNPVVQPVTAPNKVQ